MAENVLFMERNVLEDKLRKIMLLRMTMQYGSKKVKGKLLEVVESGRKEREKLQDLEINDLIENHFYLLDVKQVILKNWSLFDVTFIDKVKFENFLDVINKYRIDAHAKTIEESDLLMLTLRLQMGCLSLMQSQKRFILEEIVLIRMLIACLI